MFRKVLRFMLALLKHRVTWRFLLVVLTALGVVHLDRDTQQQLEAFVCAMVGCLD